MRSALFRQTNASAYKANVGGGGGGGGAVAACLRC